MTRLTSEQQDTQQAMEPIMGHTQYDEPQIFVTTYSLYNGGLQFKNDFTGFWITVAEYADNSRLINDSFNIQDPDQEDDHEYMITDYGNFPSELYSESGIDCDKINEWYNLDDDDKEKIKAYTDLVSDDLSEAIEKKDEMYIFEGDRGDYAKETCEDCGDVPEWLSGYVDWDSMGRDMACDGNIHEIGTNELLILQF